MNYRPALGLGAVLTVVGLAVAATAPVVGTAAIERIALQQSVGGVLVLAGWGLLAWAVHRFGRAE